MTKKENRERYNSCRPDYKNPPEGKIYIPRVLEDDPDAKATDEHVQFAAYERHIVMRRFSMTRLPCVMELVDDTPDNRAVRQEIIREMGRLCKKRERHSSENATSEMAAPLSLDKVNEETGLPEVSPASPDRTEFAVVFKESHDELKADLDARGKDRYEIFRLQKEGYTQKEIAKKLNMPSSTVSDHVKEIKAITKKHRKEVLR